MDEPASLGCDLLDQLGPQGLAKDSVDRLMGLGQAFDGIGVQGKEHFLQQFGTSPEFFFSQTGHVSGTINYLLNM